MPKFQVTAADATDHKLCDEIIEAPRPMEACAKSVADAGTADMAGSEEHLEPKRLTTGKDGLRIGDEVRWSRDARQRRSR